MDLLSKELLPPISCQSNQPEPRRSMVEGSGTGDIELFKELKVE